MIDVYPMTLGEMQVAKGVHPVGGNAMGAPIAPDPAGERGKGRGSLRQKSATEPPPASSSSIASTTAPQNALYLRSPAIDGCSSNDSSTLGTEIVRGRGRLPKRSTSTPKRMEKGTRSRTNGGRTRVLVAHQSPKLEKNPPIPSSRDAARGAELRAPPLRSMHTHGPSLHTRLGGEGVAETPILSPRTPESSTGWRRERTAPCEGLGGNR